MSDYNTPKFMEFENGMRVINIANSMHNVSTVGFTVGSREDPPWFPGAAHLFEHEAADGASEAYIKKCLAAGRPEPISSRRLIRLMNRHLGGTDGDGMNIATWHSHMSFGHTDMPRRVYMHHIFDAFAGAVRDAIRDLPRMRDPRLLNLRTHTKESAAADVEGGIGEDDNYERIRATALKLLYRSNPIRNYYDSHEALTTVKLGRLKNWAQGKFHAGTMVVIGLGPTNHEMLKMVRDAELDQLPKRQKTPFVVDPTDITPELSGVKRHIIENPDSCLSQVMLMWPTPPFLCKDQRALEVLSYVLKARVEEELRDHNHDRPGGVYHPACFWDRTSTNGTFMLWFATRREFAYLESLIERTFAVIERVQHDTTSLLEEDTEDVRLFLVDEFTSAYRFNPSDVVDLVLEAVSNGDPMLEHFRDYAKAMRRVTARDIREAANRYLPIDRYVQVIMRPAP